MPLKKQKSLTSFIAEEDGKTIKKSLLLASLGLVSGLVLGANNVQAGLNESIHNSSTTGTGHSNCHTNHNSHSSY